MTQKISHFILQQVPSSRHKHAYMVFLQMSSSNWTILLTNKYFCTCGFLFSLCTWFQVQMFQMKNNEAFTEKIDLAQSVWLRNNITPC